VIIEKKERLREWGRWVVEGVGGVGVVGGVGQLG